MDCIKRIFLILVLVLTTFSFTSAHSAELINESNVVITSANPIDKHFIDTTQNTCTISVIENSSASIIQRRSGGSNQPQNSETLDIPELKQFDKLIKYIYEKACLDDKNELALLLLLHQIQPNAP